MFQKQKESILALLKTAENNKDYRNRYWFSYQDFLDPTDHFTSFSCEDLDGKQEYIALIENLLIADENAKIFVEVYGFEEVENERFIYADTLIIFSKLSLIEIKQIFNEPQDIFPSDIGEVDDLQHEFMIDDNGDLVPAVNLPNKGDSVYYCWWD
ncbi:MAG: hypothetical protein NC417_14705 [Candidatus Gastranaerophilales bacterium]|nr:hypothetical protein [Candidatus Gastranaerophilales bacterium]